MEDTIRVRRLINSGEKQLAWSLLNQILSDNPENEAAWVLAYELAKPEVREELIYKALKFLPNSPSLRKLTTTAEIPPTNINRPKTLSERIEAHRSTREEQEQIRIRKLEDRQGLIWAALILSGLVGMFAAAAGSYIIMVAALIPFCFALYHHVGIQDELMKAGKIPHPDYDLSYRTQTTVNDLNRTTSCRSCHHSVSISAEKCPNCGLGYPGLRVQCPKCGSQDTSILGKQSFDFGRSLGGGVLLGPVGLLAGFLGKKSVEARCSDCNSKWVVKTNNIIIS